MKFSLLQENLNPALQSVSRFVSLKAQLPILSHILFESVEGRLRLSATNLEMGINYYLGAKIEVEGSFAIPARELSEFISYLPAGKLDLSLNSSSLLEVLGSKAQSTFATSSVADFPTLPTLNPSSSFEIDSKILLETVADVAFAAATDDSRPVLTAVLCYVTADSFSLIATDGFRLSIKEIKLVNPIILPDNQEKLTFLIPARTLQEIVKLSKGTEKIKMGLSSDSHQLVFALSDCEITSRLVEGDFPDYQRIVPEGYKTTIKVDKTEFAQAVKIASVFARESANVIRLGVKSNSFEVTANATQVGKNKVDVDAAITGDPLEIAINYKFVSDFLGVCQGNEITIDLNEPLTPVLFRDSKDPHFTHIIMPVRIQD